MAAVCKACEDPLIITIDPDSEDEDNQTGDEPQNVPDDLELPCGCHFHWYLFPISRSHITPLT